MKHLMQLAVGLSLLITFPVFAAGDAGAGQGKSTLCAACHGADGNSVVPNWPKIAGQHAAYLQRQLALIKSGLRPVPEMAGIVMGLNDQDIADLAAYYANQTTSVGITDTGLRVIGERLYQAGNPATDIPACMACHGPLGEGNPLSGYPSVGGQHATYTEKMLTRFKAGDSWGADDASSNIMTDVTLRMTDEEIKAVASYIQGLHASATGDGN